jgi:hypothetical protein
MNSQLEQLSEMPRLLRSLAATAVDVRTRPPDGTFAFVEQVWHLADLEQEGFGARIEAILTRDHPELPDFRGDETAVARRYLEQEVAPALERFCYAREANRARLEAVTGEEWLRTGTQEGMGVVTLAKVVELMLAHDRSHAEELMRDHHRTASPLPRSEDPDGSAAAGAGTSRTA